MPGGFKFGPLLSDADYERQIVALQQGRPAMPSRRQDRELRRRELNLKIDHRLGRDFPSVRREELWAVAQELERRRLRWAAVTLVRQLFTGRRDRHGDALFGLLKRAYARVLTPDELEAFLQLGTR
jgi:hypothetical protein